MNTSEKLETWLSKMGFEGRIPSNLRPFCNPSTALIWEQIIHSVKPRQEIEQVRNNALINKLLRNDRACSSPTVCLLKYDSKNVLKEIETWNKEQNLKKHISTVRNTLNETKSKLHSLSSHNKVKYMNLENLRQKTRENHEFTFFLSAKSKKMEVDTADAQEMLSMARSLTPIESDEQNKVEVLETLKKCAQKLEQIIEKQNEIQAAPSIVNGNSYELKTPRNKTKGKRGFLSTKKTPGLLSSTKIISQSSKKSKQNLDDSLGLLDDLSVTFDNALAASSFKEMNFSNVGTSYDLPILNNEELNELLGDLLHNHNRNFVWNALSELNEHCKAELFNAVIQSDKTDLSSATLERKDKVLLSLFATHVDFELKALNIKVRVKALEQQRCKLQEAIFTPLSNKTSSPSQLSEQKNLLQFRQRQSGLAAAIEYIDKASNCMQETTGNQNALQAAREKARNVEKNIAVKLSCIEHKLNIFKQIFDSMSQARSETFMLIRKLGQFTLDSSWTRLLGTSVVSAEIDTFFDFPLEYNRMGTAATFLRDLPVNYIPHQENFDSNLALIFVTLLQSPWSPAESLLTDIVRAKTKVELLKAVKYIPDDVKATGYTLEELQSQESYINYTLDKLKSMIHGESINKNTQTLAQVREMIRLWLEMPVKNFISPNRLFNGAPYEHYEKLYENSYKKL